MNKYILCVSVSLCLLMSSCLNDEFLEVYPKGQQTEDAHPTVQPMTIFMF